MKGNSRMMYEVYFEDRCECYYFECWAMHAAKKLHAQQIDVKVRFDGVLIYESGHFVF